MNWSDGYVADAEYLNQFYSELAPPHLDLAALAANVTPPDREGGRFRYCELGCGNGSTTNILAASHPNAEFVGIDFMPVHIANSRKVAKKAGLKNIKFYELSFAEACNEDFGQFDYIVAHGVYSWVSPENRREMVEFFRRFLAPGGLVYLSYNTYPGWSAIAPVQKVVSEYAKTLQGPSPQRVRGGFDFAAQLLSKGSQAFDSQPAARKQIESAPTQAPNYLAQEYLNEAWYPLYVTDVMRELAPAKLEYVASATLGDNDLRFLVSDDLAALIRAQPTESLRQLVKDVSINARFRRDIYTRGGRRLSGLDQRQAIAERRVALTRTPDALTFTTTYGTRSLNFDTPAARTVVSALATGPKSLRELAAVSNGAADPMRVALETATILCVGSQAQWVDAKQSVGQEMNRVLTSAALEDTSCNTLATTLGTGLPVSIMELALLANPANFESIDAGAAFLTAQAARKGRIFNKHGQRIEGDEAVSEFLREEVKTIFSRVSVFQQFGLLPTSLKVKGAS